MDRDIQIKLLREDLDLLMQAERTMAKVLANTRAMALETAVANADTDRAVAKLRREAEEFSARHRSELEDMRRQMNEGFRLSKERMDRIELVLAEAGDKLNGLIGYMDGQSRRP